MLKVYRLNFFIFEKIFVGVDEFFSVFEKKPRNSFLFSSHGKTLECQQLTPKILAKWNIVKYS